LEPVDGLDTPAAQRFAPVGEHPRGFEFAVDLQDTQSLGSDRDDRDRVSIARVGLAVVAGVEQPHPGSELGRHVQDALTGLQEPLGQWSTGAVGALHCPDPLRPGLGVGSHRGVAGLIGGEPTRAQPLLVVIDDLDGGRQLVGIDPDDDVFHVLLPPVLIPMWTARWAVLLRARAVPS